MTQFGVKPREGIPTRAQYPLRPLLLGTALLAPAAGFLVVGKSLLVGLVFLGAIILVAALRKPFLVVHGAIWLAFAAWPAALPTHVEVAGFWVYLYQILLPAAILVARRESKARRLTSGERLAVALTGIWISLMGLSALRGLVIGYPLGDVVADVREIYDLCLGAFLAFYLFRHHKRSAVLTTLQAVLWFSLFMIFVSMATGMTISGRAEEAQLYSTNGGVLGAASSAIRYITPATNLALACALIAFSLLLLGQGKRYPKAKFFLWPSLAICLLSFSRNQLVALLVTLILVSIIAVVKRGILGLTVLVKRLAVMAVVGCMAVLILLAAPVTAQSTKAALASYESRVLAGLSGSTEARDTSVQDRDLENVWLQRAISDNAVLGSGLGYRYKPALGNPGDFSANQGRMYAHNYYLWLWAKTGLISLATFCASISSVIYLSLRRLLAARDLSFDYLMGIVPLVSFLAISVVAPVPRGMPGAVAFGAAWVLCWLGSYEVSVRDGNGGRLGYATARGE